MKDYSIFSDNWCNQVFDGRNKDYGAYQLRKSGDENTFSGLIVSVGFSTISLAFPLVLTLFNPDDKPDDHVTVFDQSEVRPLTEILIETKEIVKPALQKKSNENLSPLISDSTEMPPDTNYSDPQNKSDNNSQDTSGVTSDHTTGGGTLLVETVDTNIYLPLGIGVEPLFPGDEKGLVAFFKRMTRYPGDAYSEGKTGTVYISFLIGKTGKVSEATVLRGVPGVPSLEREALRVVNLMPDWSPGMQNGKPVTVRYTVPVSFSIR